MANTKMTYAQAFAIAKEVLENSTHPDREEAIAKIQAQMDNLAKKASAPSKAQTAKATANMGLGELVVEFLRANPDKSFTITEMMKEISGLPAEITNQKLTAILRLDSVKPFYTREMVKGKAKFQYKMEE